MLKYFFRKLSSRKPESLRKHYETEKEIAQRLKRADRKTRKKIYISMYDELFEKIPDHSRLKRRESDKKSKQAVKYNLNFIKKHLKSTGHYLEFAPGDGKLAFEVARKAEKVTAVDISDQLPQNAIIPRNMQLVIYDGYTLDLLPECADLVFSNQLIEHFHPEDTEAHFRLVHRLLKPNCGYAFKTPHRFSGPWDISRYFSNTPEGFHLKEWTYIELIDLLKNVGFNKVETYYYLKLVFFRFPILYFTAVEKFFSIFPKSIRQVISFFFIPHIAIKAYK